RDGLEAVAIATQVSEEDVTPARTRDAFQQFARALIGKMAMASADALFERPRSLGVGLEQLRAVIGLNDDHVDLAQVFVDVLWRVAEVGQPCEAAPRRKQIVGEAVAETKSDGILRIMRHLKTRDLEIAKLKRGAGFKIHQIRIVAEIHLHGARGYC